MSPFVQWLSDILPSGAVERAGWTLLHSVWQFALLGAVLVLAERLLIRRSASVKYIITSIVLCVMAGSSILTFVLVDVEPARPTPLAGSTLASQAETPPLGFNGYVLDNGRLHAMYVGSESLTPQEWDKLPDTPAQDHATRSEDASTESESLRTETPLTDLANHVRPWLPVCVSGWLIGVAITALRLVAGVFNLRRLRRSRRTAVSKDVHRLLAATAERLGVRRAVDIARSSLVKGPVVIGWLKPLILLPASSLTGLTTEQLEAVLAHELAHVRRFDYLVNLLQTIVETIFFYHPAVWWVSRRMRIHREDCCDDRAVSVLATPVAYAAALLKLHELQSVVKGPESEMAMPATGGSLKKRIHRVLGFDDESQSAPVWWCSLTVVGAIVLVAGCGLLASDAQARREQEQKERAEILAKVKAMAPTMPDERTGLFPSANTPEEREQVLQQLDALGVARSRELGITPDRGPGAKPFSAQLWDVPDEAWSQLGRLKTIRKLSMTACQNSPEAFRHIAGLRLLDQLTVTNSRFEPEHLAALAGLSRLLEIDAMLTVFHSEFDRKSKLGQLSVAEQERFDEIAGPDLRQDHIAEASILTDRAMLKLSGLKNLRKLSLQNTFVTNFGMTALVELQELRYLKISVGEPVSSATTEMLSSMPHLEELYLMGNIDRSAADRLKAAPMLRKLELRAINDDVAKAVAEIQTLEWLRLWASSLSDDCLLELAKLENLKHLDVHNAFRGTLTLSGIKRFQAARPGCEVVHDFRPKTLTERRIPLPDDHFVIRLRWHKATSRQHLAEEMQKRFGDSEHWVEFRPLTREGFIGGIALLRGKAGRDWLKQQLKASGDFDMTYAEPLTVKRLKNEGVMFETLLKPLRKKAQTLEVDRINATKSETNVGAKKLSTIEKPFAATNQPLPPFNEVVAQLREQGHEKSADWMQGRNEFLQKRVKDKHRGVLVYGQVVAPPGDLPRYCDAQMTIVDGGWFVDIIGDKDRPVSFRMFGCRPVDVVPSRLQPDIKAGEMMSLGRIVMESFQPEDLATVRGQLKFEGDDPPSGILARIIIRSGKANSATGGTDGFLEWPEKENVTLSNDLQFEHRRLAPLPHRLRIETRGFRTVWRDLEPQAGATLDLGTIEIGIVPKFHVEVLASDTTDFSAAKLRKVTVPLGEVWKSNPENEALRKYSGGDMRFLRFPVDRRQPDGEQKLVIHSGVASLKLADLGEGSLDTFRESAFDPPKLRSSRDIVVQSGHVYLGYHTHWKHWTLLRVTMD